MAPYHLSVFLRFHKRWSAFALVAGIVVVAGILRFIRLDHQSLWLDEAYTIFYATSQSWSEVLHNFVEAGENGPLYTLTMRFWISLGTSSAVWIRAFSAIFGVLTIPVSLYFFRQFLAMRVSLIAAALMALSPFLVWYSQEGRQYSLFAFLAVASYAICAGLIRARTPIRLTSFAAANSIVLILAMMTHLFAIWLVIVQAGFVLAAWPVGRRIALIWLASAVLPAALLLAQNITMMGPSTSFGYSDPGLLGLISTTLYVLVSNGKLPPGLVLGGAAFLGASALVLQRRAGQPHDGLDGIVEPRRVVPYLVFSITAPLLVYYVFSLVVNPVALPRYFAFLAVPLLALMACGIDALYGRSRLAGVISGGVLAIAFVGILVNSYVSPEKPDFKSAFEQIAGDSIPSDLIVVRPSVMVFPVRHYASSFPRTVDVRIRPVDSRPEGEVLREIRSASEFWIVDVSAVDETFPSDLQEIAVDVAGYVSEVDEYYGIRVARIVVNRRE